MPIPFYLNKGAMPSGKLYSDFTYIARVTERTVEFFHIDLAAEFEVHSRSGGHIGRPHGLTGG